MPGSKFSNLEELAAHLIDKMYVDTRTTSAYAVMTAMQKKKIKQEGETLFSTLHPVQNGSKKHPMQFYFAGQGLPNGIGPGMESQDYKRKIEVSSNICHYFLGRFFHHSVLHIQVPPPPEPPMKRGNLKRSKYSPTLANMVQRGPGTSKDSHGGKNKLLISISHRLLCTFSAAPTSFFEIANKVRFL